MTVVVITYCRKIELLYGSTLVFDSLRVGFPDAKVVVIDNSSIHEAHKAIKSKAESIDANFANNDSYKEHHILIEKVLSQISGPVCIVDPDVIFWDRIPEPTSLIEGRLIPRFKDAYAQCVAEPRIHTSMMYVRDTDELQKRITEIKKTYVEFDPWIPIMLKVNGAWRRWDTGACLYAAAPKLFRPYGKKELNCYDHLFCGSHIDLVEENVPEIAYIHELPHDELKGIWKLQEQYFNKVSI